MTELFEAPDILRHLLSYRRVIDDFEKMVTFIGGAVAQYQSCIEDLPKLTQQKEDLFAQVANVKANVEADVAKAQDHLKKTQTDVEKELGNLQARYEAIMAQNTQCEIEFKQISLELQTAHDQKKKVLDEEIAERSAALIQLNEAIKKAKESIAAL